MHENIAKAGLSYIRPDQDTFTGGRCWHAVTHQLMCVLMQQHSGDEASAAAADLVAQIKGGLSRFEEVWS